MISIKQNMGTHGLFSAQLEIHAHNQTRTGLCSFSLEGDNDFFLHLYNTAHRDFPVCWTFFFQQVMIISFLWRKGQESVSSTCTTTQWELNLIDRFSRTHQVSSYSCMTTQIEKDDFFLSFVYFFIHNLKFSTLLTKNDVVCEFE